MSSASIPLRYNWELGENPDGWSGAKRTHCPACSLACNSSTCLFSFHLPEGYGKIRLQTCWLQRCCRKILWLWMSYSNIITLAQCFCNHLLRDLILHGVSWSLLMTHEGHLILHVFSGLCSLFLRFIEQGLLLFMALGMHPWKRAWNFQPEKEGSISQSPKIKFYYFPLWLVCPWGIPWTKVWGQTYLG